MEPGLGLRTLRDLQKILSLHFKFTNVVQDVT
jgi:hypothetical protein